MFANPLIQEAFTLIRELIVELRQHREIMEQWIKREQS